MENTTLIQNNGGGRAPVKIQLKPTVKDFIAAVQLGVDAWEKAGEILVALINEDATIKKQIIDAAPWITNDTLEIFYSIGIHTLYPMTMLLPRHVASAVRVMRYDAQKKVCAEPVQVVARMVTDKPVIERKPVAKLTEKEVRQALWPKGNRSVEWQVRAIENEGRERVKQQEWGRLSAVPAPAPRMPQSVGWYSVRRAVGGGFAFEKTTARPITMQQVLLTDGQATIELTEYKD